MNSPSASDVRLGQGRAVGSVLASRREREEEEGGTMASNTGLFWRVFVNVVRVRMDCVHSQGDDAD